MSFSDNCIPDDMKIARVKPLYRKNNLDVGNYTPVSILSVVSKILEKKKLFIYTLKLI